MNGKPLSHRETRILGLLAHGMNYRQIAETVGISYSNLQTTTWIIRQKTGIKHTRDREECRTVLRRLTADRIARATDPTERDPKLSLPTACQMRVITPLVQGRSYAEIAQSLGISEASARHYASLALKRLGINVPPWKRLDALKQWASPATNTMADPAF